MGRTNDVEIEPAVVGEGMAVPALSPFLPHAMSLRLLDMCSPLMCDIAGLTTQLFVLNFHRSSSFTCSFLVVRRNKYFLSLSLSALSGFALSSPDN